MLGWKVYLCAGLTTVAAAGYHGLRLSGHAAAARPPTALAQPLALLPMVIHGWQGNDIVLSDEIIRCAGADDHLRRDYAGTDGATVSLYIAFYGSVRDHVPHGPNVCYPSQGWAEEHDEMLELPSEVPAFGTLHVRKLQFARDGARVAVLYWYAANGRQQVGAARQKLDAALRDLLGGGAYVFQVMVTCPIARSPAEAFGAARSFLTAAFPHIAAHFPGAAPLRAPRAELAK
jgi:EpsI family protein